jgi:hypothetical protein
LALTPVVEVDASEVEVVDVVPGGSGAAGAAGADTGRRLSRMNSHYKECGFDSGKAVAEAREDTIIAAVSEDSKQDEPAYLADKKLGAPTGGLETAWTRVQALVDADDAKRDVKLWPGGCLDWRSLRDRFFQIMQNFTKEAPTKTGDRGEHTQTTDTTSERYVLLGRLRCAWEDKKKAFKNMQDATTADRQADAEQAAKRRDFVKKAACSRRNLGGAMDDASERVDDCGDEGGTFTTPGAATCDFHPTSTRNKKAKTAAVDANALRDAAAAAHQERETNAERRHAELVEERRLGREQDAGFRREEIDLKKKKAEAGERTGAEINELKQDMTGFKQDLTGVKAKVGELAETVQKSSEEVKAMLRDLLRRGGAGPA